MNRTVSCSFLAESSQALAQESRRRVRPLWSPLLSHLGMFLVTMALTLLLVCFLGAMQMSGSPSDAPTLSLRSMNTAPPGGAAAPPPPPPSSPAEPIDTPPALQLDLPTLGLQVSNPEAPAIQARISQGLDFKLQPMHFAATAGEAGTGDGSGQPGLAQGSLTFGLADLDAQPQLISRPSVTFPASQLRRGVREAKVVLEVLIKSNGTVVVKRVLESPHEDFSAMARSFATRSRFTPPKKDGRPVNLVFKWPLILKS